MADFRKITPSRRSTVPTVKNHNEYRPLLREDFHQRCGYCGDHDFFRDTYYEIDHFVPKKYLVEISSTEYSNLVYSCRSCNNFKRAKWPTKNESIHNDGRQGFIDPCNNSYSFQFERMKDGSIQPKTQLGSWMWSALNMGNPAHRIKWNLEQLKLLIEELDKLDNLNVKELIRIKKMNALYRSLEEQLRGVPNFY